MQNKPNFFFLKPQFHRIQEVFAPQTGNKAFIAFLSDTIFNFEAKEAKFFFFRSKNPDNLRGFCPPNPK